MGMDQLRLHPILLPPSTSRYLGSPDGCSRFSNPRTQPTAAVDPRLDSMELLGIASYLANRISMTIDEQQMFGRFRLMNSLTYTTDITEDVYEFIVSCHERLHNLGLVELHKVDYTTLQITSSAKQWWKDYIRSRPARSPPLSWTRFTQVFLAKFVPQSERERKRAEIEGLQQDRMSVAKYEG
ncbi:hypothetical protein R3W88_027126 [Solanum pinnatisectum]|uniref:Retrotransposon gag domain-containing protein n=1 Tax=Solanum pinnatisectum TaxID=50273 RepID=A0AAV9LIY0_9SOLN|nr:hypothetical protein R3W88_027126 [Solanum pinnatisectum]